MCGFVASCSCPLPGHDGNGRAGNHDNGTKDETDGSGPRQAMAKVLQQGIDSIKHRGPDGSGIWVSTNAAVGLAHCRLTIVDLSPGGAQPLHSDDGLIHAVVNGEIYDNHGLRQICASEHGYRFAGESDSELVVSLYKVHGVPGLFEHLRGEFSFVLFDERKGSQKIVAARDRFGIKPLFWMARGDRILFASEAKAFLAFGWKPEWDVRAITDCGWMLNESTCFKGVAKLMPGHWIEITQESGVEIRKYWDAEYSNKACLDPAPLHKKLMACRQSPMIGQ